MKTKIFSLFAICFMCVALLTGCANINYTFFQNANGTISELFSVTLDPNILQEIDCDLFSQEIKTVTDDWKNSHSEQLSKAGVHCDGAKVEEKNGKYIISIEINYDTPKAYNDAWSSGGGGSSEPQYQRGWFQDKYIIYQGKTEFAGSLSSTMATSLTTWIEANYPDYDWQSKLKNISGAYVRIYPSQIAPYIDEGGVRLNLPEANYTYCIWNFNMSEPNFEITMYKNVITAHNKANWFISGLIVTAICAVLLFFLLRERKRKTPQQVVEEFLQGQQGTTENTQPTTEKMKEDEQTLFFGLTGVDQEDLNKNISLDKSVANENNEQEENPQPKTEEAKPEQKPPIDTPKKHTAKQRKTDIKSEDEEK